MYVEYFFNFYLLPLKSIGLATILTRWTCILKKIISKYFYKWDKFYETGIGTYENLQISKPGMDLDF